MTHSELSVSEMCTYPLPFAAELPLWDELQMQHVGLLANKVDDHGRDEAIKLLTDRGVSATTIISASFDLADQDSWPATRASIGGAVDLAAVLGGCVYFTPGRRVARWTFDQLTDALAEALEPCLGYARQRGVRLAIEPSLRTDVSFVHTLRDGLEVARRAGIDVIADIGNCWMERDVEHTVRRAGPYLAAVQIGDVVWGGPGSPPPGGRAVPGDGDVPMGAFIRAAREGGYNGPFELEIVGPLIEQEGHIPATRRAVQRASALLEEVL